MTIEEQLKKLGLLGRYQDIKTKQDILTKADIKSTVGTKEATDEILSKGKGLLADQIADVGEVNLPEPPDTPPDLTGASSRLAFLEEQSRAASEAADKARKENERLKKEADAKEKTWMQKLMDKETKEEKREAEFEEIDIKPTEYFAEQKDDIAEVSKLMEEYDKKVAIKDTAIATIESRAGADIGYISREAAEIAKKHNIELSQVSSSIKTKLAVMEMEKGNFEQARNFVREAVDDYTFDLKLEYDLFTTFKEDNKDMLADLDNKYTDALDKAESFALEAYNQAYDEQNKVGELMLEYPTANIKIGDTLQEATEKAGRVSPETEYALPTSYKEWELAGKSEGTGKTYAEWISQGGTKLTTAMKNYQLALGEGYTGSFAEWSGKGTDKDALAEEIAYLQTYKNREEALSALEMNQTALVISFGVSGFNQFLDEVDRIYPPPPEAPKTKLLTPVEAGKNVGEVISHIPGAYEEAFIKTPLRWAEEAGKATTGFFQGLFGK